MMENDELGRMGRKSVMTYFRILINQQLRVAEEKTQNAQGR